MTPNEFRAELKKLSGGYLFCGEENYLKRHYLDALRKASVDVSDVFNHISINSESYTPERLFSAIEALPMMAEKKLIEISSLPFSQMKEDELDEFCSVMQRLSDYEYNIVVVYTETDELDIGTDKAPSKEFAMLCKHLTPVVFAKETPARLASWTAKHFASELIIAPPDEVRLLLDRCGCDMFALSNEIDKLSCYLKSQGRERLTKEDIILICGERKEIAAFDFANAILDGDPKRAFSILDEMKNQKEKPELILAGISRVVGDLVIIRTMLDRGLTYLQISEKLKGIKGNGSFSDKKVALYAKNASRTTPERLNRLAERCYDADMLIKSTPLDKYVVLERLVAEASSR